jgi:predicted phosphoribosyltransferase
MKGFANRREAGRHLAERLREYADREDVTLLALPRGGVPVAYEVAIALGVPLDVFLVRKIGAPFNEELAVGAIASGGVCLLDGAAIAALVIPQAAIEKAISAERVELERRERLYRGARAFPDLRGRTVILIDDGLATGASMTAAVEALRAKAPAGIIVAAPIASRDACTSLRALTDGCVCVALPEPLYGVGAWYDDFAQTTDTEVLELLAAARRKEDRDVVVRTNEKVGR